jgi:hypothetical protein
MVNATKIIVNATQQAQEQLQNATNATETLTRGWYKNYAVGLYETKYVFDVKDADGNSIQPSALLDAVVNGILYVLADTDNNGKFDSIYKVSVSDGKATKYSLTDISNTPNPIPIGASLNCTSGQYIVLYDGGVYYLVDTQKTTNQVIPLNGVQIIDNTLWGYNGNNIYRLDLSTGILTYYNTGYTVDDIKAIDANNIWVIAQDATPAYYAIKVSYDSTKNTLSGVKTNALQAKDQAGTAQNISIGIADAADANIKHYYWVAVDANNAWIIGYIQDSNDNNNYYYTLTKVTYANNALTPTSIEITDFKIGANAPTSNNIGGIKAVDANNIWAIVGDSTPAYYAIKASYDSATTSISAVTSNALQATDQAGTAQNISPLNWVAGDANDAWIIGYIQDSNDNNYYYTLTKVTYANNALTPTSIEITDFNNGAAAPTFADIKAVDANNIWAIAADSTPAYHAIKASYDSATTSISAVTSNALQDGTGANLAAISTFDIIPGKNSYAYVAKGADKTVILYYDSDTNAINLYPVDKGVQTINAGAYVQEPTKVLVYDSTQKYKVYAFDFNNNKWVLQASLDSSVTPRTLKTIDTETYISDTNTQEYLLKYQNNTLAISKYAIPSSVEFTKYIYATVDTATGLADVYYKTYNELDQWGVLKVRVHLPEAINNGAASTFLYNNTLYTVAGGSTTGLDVALISIENEKDATPVNELEITDGTLQKVIYIPDSNGTFAAIDGNVLYKGNLFGSENDIKAANIGAIDITADSQYIYAVDNDYLYKLDNELNNEATKVTDSVVSGLKKVAYVNNALAVIGITTDNNVAVKFYDPQNLQALSDWLKITGYTSGEEIKPVVNGNYLYLDIGSNLYIVDASSATQPKLVNATLSNVKSFSVLGDIGYGMTTDGKIEKISLQNPANLTIVNSTSIGNYTSLSVSAAKLYAYGDYVFVTDNANPRVEIYNMANVTANATEAKYMGDADVKSPIANFIVKLINGKYYLISADGKYIHVLNLNPKEVK